MQDPLDAFEALISTPRFNTYLGLARGDKKLAYDLYRWNAEVANSLAWTMHFAEIAIRNGVSSHLARRFGRGWTDARQFRNQLDLRDAEALRRTFDRQAMARRPESPTDDQVVADLSFGFWVSILRQRYAVPFGWASAIGSIFPYAHDGLRLGAVQAQLDTIRAMRNRVAHHEPIVHRGTAHAIAVRNKAFEIVEWANRPAAELIAARDPLLATLARDPRDLTRKA